MAYQAARAGIEWGVYQAIEGTGCASSSFPLPLTVATTPASTVNYTVTVACTQATATEGSTSINVYQITATANNAAGGNFHVERQLTATVSK